MIKHVKYTNKTWTLAAEFFRALKGCHTSFVYSGNAGLFVVSVLFFFFLSFLLFCGGGGGGGGGRVLRDVYSLTKKYTVTLICTLIYWLVRFTEAGCFWRQWPSDPQSVVPLAAEAGPQTTEVCRSHCTHWLCKYDHNDKNKRKYYFHVDNDDDEDNNNDNINNK